MARTGATIYDLLVSCPGDVLDLKEIVKDCVEDFNRLYGKINNIKIEVKHWSTDSYPESGGRPQDLLNNQFIHECDACVALFANKFGTPTDKYGSGTEEEIEDMISSGKQVFLYFIERPVDPNTIDIDQLSKVRNFKERYSGRGIYWPIKDNEDFRKSFMNHLTLYFLKLISDPKDSNITARVPKLEFVMSDGTTNARIKYSNFRNISLFTQKDLTIFNLIERIKLVEIHNSIECENEMIDIAISLNSEEDKIKEKKDKGLDQELLKQLNDISKISSRFNDIPGLSKKEYKDVLISDKIKSDIVRYCNEKNIEIEERFWFLGNLKREIIGIRLPYSKSENLKGTEEEKIKYKLIKELWNEIYEYNEYFEFFSQIDNMPRLNCIIANNGTTYDEDIDIKILIHKGHILKKKDFPIPGPSCIDEINNKNLCNYLYCGKKTDTIDQYSDYPKSISFKTEQFINIAPFNKASEDEIYNMGKKEYLNSLSDIFCYEYFEKDEVDILKFKISYLKQNTNMYLPSILFFRSIPQYIEYEIRSKHMPGVISGKLEVYK